MEKSREKWLEERKAGIGGSDAATIVGLNPYSDNIKLWEIKTKRAEQEDISNKPCVKYGVEMENNLRNSFAIKHPEFEVEHEENKIIKHPKYPFLFASLDGILTNKKTGEKGILEIKTSEVLRKSQKVNIKKGEDMEEIDYQDEIFKKIYVTLPELISGILREVTYEDENYEDYFEIFSKKIKEVVDAEIESTGNYLKKIKK